MAPLRDALDRWPLVVVHGLPGMGTSHAVGTELGGAAVRVDLSRAESPREVRAAIRERLRLEGRLTTALRGRRDWIWLDDVRAPGSVERVLAPLLTLGPRFIVSSHRALTIESACHRLVAPLDGATASMLLRTELDRLGASVTSEEHAELLALGGGWPRALLELAAEARLRGARATVHAARAGRLDGVTDALGRATADLTDEARAFLGACARARAPTIRAHLVAEGARDTLDALHARGLVCPSHGVVAPALVAPLMSASGHAEHARATLALAERAREQRRCDPAGASRLLRTLLADLGVVREGATPRERIRAALALEALLLGRLERDAIIGLYEEARALAREHAPDLLPASTLALVRTWIGRGEHESALALLDDAPELDADDSDRAYALVYRAHLLAWQGELAEAELALAQARSVHADPPADIATNIDAQAGLIALEAGRPADALRLARRVAERAERAPLPRARAAADVLAGNAALAEGRAGAAIASFRAAKIALADHGDDAGAVYLGTRLAEALREAGHEDEARREAARAHAAAEDGREPTLAFAAAVAHGAIALSTDAVRLQIPSLRERAETMARDGSTHTLYLDAGPRSVSLGGTTLTLARRPSLWGVLRALTEAHPGGRTLDADALFDAGWPDEHVPATSRKKRVHTAIWTLRKQLLGELLERRDQGYVLAARLRIS